MTRWLACAMMHYMQQVNTNMQGFRRNVFHDCKQWQWADDVRGVTAVRGVDEGSILVDNGTVHPSRPCASDTNIDQANIFLAYEQL